MKKGSGKGLIYKEDETLSERRPLAGALFDRMTNGRGRGFMGAFPEAGTNIQGKEPER